MITNEEAYKKALEYCFSMEDEENCIQCAGYNQDKCFLVLIDYFKHEGDKNGAR